MILRNDIVQEGSPVLRKRAIDVPLPLNEADLSTIRSLMEYVLNSQNELLVTELDIRASVGIAAPQIGVAKRMFAMSATDEKNEVLHQYAVLNPKIISSSEEQTYLPSGEGCLSVDESKNGLVSRATRIKAKVTLVDLSTGTTEEVLLKLAGYPSVVFQHEYDHLQGILFVDKVKPELPNAKPILFEEEETEE